MEDHIDIDDDINSTKREIRKKIRESRGKKEEHILLSEIPMGGPVRHERGLLKIIILMTLKDQPMHGYALIKSIEANHGFAPSAGTIYPTLQMMEDEELISLNEEKNKKTYSITQKGLQLLEENIKTVEKITSTKEEINKTLNSKVQEQFSLIARIIFANKDFLNAEKEEAILKSLEETRRHIGQIIFAEVSKDEK